MCNKSSYEPIRKAVKLAKNEVRQLGKCVDAMSKTELMIRESAWVNLVNARNAENMCWVPPHPNHISEITANEKNVLRCQELLKNAE